MVTTGMFFSNVTQKITWMKGRLLTISIIQLYEENYENRISVQLTFPPKKLS